MSQSSKEIQQSTTKINWNIPDDVLESLARCFLPDIIAFYETEEGQKYFEEWKAQKKNKNTYLKKF